MVAPNVNPVMVPGQRSYSSSRAIPNQTQQPDDFSSGAGVRFRQDLLDGRQWDFDGEQGFDDRGRDRALEFFQARRRRNVPPSFNTFSQVYQVNEFRADGNTRSDRDAFLLPNSRRGVAQYEFNMRVFAGTHLTTGGALNRIY